MINAFGKRPPPRSWLKGKDEGVARPIALVCHSTGSGTDPCRPRRGQHLRWPDHCDRVGEPAVDSGGLSPSWATPPGTSVFRGHDRYFANSVIAAGPLPSGPGEPGTPHAGQNLPGRLGR
ncbi:hypothetical protein GCM10012275_25350 [Longimycelium tulufanense]|uniref:Uncharacterized protein n=1 Tax=Longimycelium tulufanense TaxID=907463 RepID=A0A8J3CB47_9PSEU|nr:hypothetical protein GCM10012275_25350 [Longimycelium tulufanense]